jgi:isopentenyl phosphate kinase
MERSSLASLILCKLGGSVITDKQKPATPREEIIEQLAQEVRGALRVRPDLGLVLGHGSGSFGHVVSARYLVHKGLQEGQDWRGYAETGAAAARLNRIVADTFLRVGVPVVSIQPSASACCQEGKLVAMETRPIRECLRHGLIPLVYGDVGFDQFLGCTIVSTEAVLAYLARELKPDRMIMVGVVGGVYDRDPLQDPRAQRIPAITPGSYQQVQTMLGGSHGIDVTGGMLSKVSEMVALVAEGITRRVYLVSGERRGSLTRALLGEDVVDGTVIAPDPSPICG